MHLSATAITALLLAAGLECLDDTATESSIDSAATSAAPQSTPQTLQDKAGDGAVRQAEAA